MNRWFRMYDELLEDPKVQNLPPEDFRAWVNLLCLANRNDGVLPDIQGIAFALRIDEIAARSLVDRLRIATLIDPLKGGRNGKRYAPHGWAKRQYKSDGSTERVKRYRQRCSNGERNGPRSRDRTDTERAPLPPENLNGKSASMNGHGEPPEPERLTVEEVVDAWNATAGRHDLPQVMTLDPERRARVESLIAEHDFERWGKVISSVAQSDYLHGRNQRGWRITFDWMVTPENFAKILEGNYDDRPAQAH